MEASEIYGVHELPRDMLSFTNELQQLLHEVGTQSIGNGIQPKSTQSYARRVNQLLNR